MNLDKLKDYGNDIIIGDTTIIKRPELCDLGSHIGIDEFNVFTTGLKLGSWIHITNHISCIGGKTVKLVMGNFTTIACGCRIICGTDKHNGYGLVSPLIPNEYRDEVIFGNVTMEDYSALGTNVIVMPNVRLAKGVVIGANSLVRNSIDEEFTIWVGNPLRKLKDRPREKMEEYGRILLNE